MQFGACRRKVTSPLQTPSSHLQSPFFQQFFRCRDGRSSCQTRYRPPTNPFHQRTQRSRNWLQSPHLKALMVLTVKLLVNSTSLCFRAFADSVYMTHLQKKHYANRQIDDFEL
jgi:hypothetical protein